jgi:hypothetical protein
MTCDDRANELHSLKITNPRQLIALYRAATDTPDLGQLPAGISFAAMIDEIIRHEEAAGNFREPPQTFGAA